MKQLHADIHTLQPEFAQKEPEPCQAHASLSKGF